MAGIDYSKWNNIEISDDEDDVHPNIDTPSLFKWRHEARVMRQEELDVKKKATLEEKKAKERQVKELREKIKKAEKSDPSVDSLTKSLGELEKSMEEVKEKEKEVMKEEKNRPWNVDTISKEGFSKTVMNQLPGRNEKEMTEDEKLKYMKEFTEKYSDELRQFGLFRKYDDSLRFLQDGRTHLACEETANFLVIECINHAMEEKFELMDHVAHQCICIQYLLELAKQLDIDPRACIASFFKKIQIADDEYKKAFTDELTAFKLRIRRRAKEKVAEQMEEIKKEQEEERQARLGPGGLDPAEVFETLPETLQECFESQDIGRLQQVIRDLDEKDARYHMKRCVDAGLWKPAEDDPSTNPEDGFRKAEEGDDREEEIYDEVEEKKEEEKEKK